MSFTSLYCQLEKIWSWVKTNVTHNKADATHNNKCYICQMLQITDINHHQKERGPKLCRKDLVLPEASKRLCSLPIVDIQARLKIANHRKV